MKKLFVSILITSLSLVLGCDLFAAVNGASTQGSEFYFSFMRARSAREKTMTLFVSSEITGNLELTNPQTGTTQTYVIGVGKTEIALATTNSNSDETAVTISGAHKDCYTTIANSPQNDGYYVHATDASGNDIKVSLYASLSGSKTADAANVYPLEALGNDYYVISRSGNSKSGDANFFPSEALIVATEDCDVDIYPTCLLDGYSGTNITNKISISLLKGQTYLLRAASALGKYSDGASNAGIGSNDLTGTRIVLKDDGNVSGNKCKKIAVFAGTQHGSGENTAYNNGDYEYDQLFPIHLWGTKFVVGSPDSYGSAVTRVVASKPCTQVRVNGTLVATLNPSDFYEYKDTQNTGCYIETSKPVGAAFFTTGQNIGSGADGAPAMITIAPMEQSLKSITFTAIANSGITEHSLMITSPTSVCQNTTLVSSDGTKTTLNSSSGYIWTPIAANTAYSSLVYRGLSTSVSYTLANAGGFNAYVYGSKGTDVGYGYSVGSAANIINTSFDLNTKDSTYNSSVLSREVCVGDSVTLKPAFASGAIVSSVRWTVTNSATGIVLKDTTATDADYAINVKFPTQAIYKVNMIVYKTSSACFANMGNDTVNAEFNVKQYYYEQKQTKIVCKGASVTIPLRAQLASSTESNLRFTWYDDATGKEVSGQTTRTFNTTALVDYGQTKTYVLYSWDVTDRCNVYVDTLQVSVVQSISTDLKISNATGGSLNAAQTELDVCNDGSTTATIVGTLTQTPANNIPVTPKEKWTSDGSEFAVTNRTYSFKPSKTEEITYLVTVSDENGNVCQSASSSVTIKARPTFTASLTAESGDFISDNLLPMSGGKGTLTVITQSTTSEDAGPFTYSWTPEGSGSNYNWNLTEEKSYAVTVTGGDGLCTTTTNAVTIKVGNVALSDVLIPNSESNYMFGRYPYDKDSKKYDFSKQLIDMFTRGYTITIYNRYGIQITKTTNDGWDGKKDGNYVDAGTYFYILEYKTSKGSKTMKGTLDVVKK